MKPKVFQIFLSFVFLVAIFFPVSVALAANCTNNPFPDQANSVTSQLPLFCSASQFGNWAITILLSVAASVTIIFVIIGGYYYMTAAGNEEQSEKGRKILTNSLIGLVVIIMSFAIVRIVANTLTGGTNSNQTNNPANNSNNNAPPASNNNSASTPQDVVMNMYNSGQLKVGVDPQVDAIYFTASFPVSKVGNIQNACQGASLEFALKLSNNNITKHTPFVPTGSSYLASITIPASQLQSKNDTVIFELCGVLFPSGGLPFIMPSQLQNVNQ